MKRVLSNRGVELYETTGGVRMVYVRYQSGGRAYLERIGPSVKERGRDVTMAKARRVLEQRRAEILQARANGQTWVSPRVAAEQAKEQAEAQRASAVLFCDFAARFLVEYIGRGKTPPRSSYYKQQVASLNAYFGDVPVREIDAMAVDRYGRHLTGENLAPTSIRKRLVALDTMLRFARKVGVVDTVPEIDKPGGEGDRYRPLTPEEWGRLVATIESDPKAHAWELPLVRLTLATVSRRQEIVGLRWADVADGTMALLQGKTRLEKKVPVGREAKEALKAREPFRFTSEYVFTGDRGRKLDGRFVSRTFAERLAAAGIEDRAPDPARAAAGIMDRDAGRVSLHSLRSTAATWLANSGASELQIGAMLGHRGAATVTARYAHVEVTPDLVETLDTLTERAEAVYRDRVSAVIESAAMVGTSQKSA